MNNQKKKVVSISIADSPTIERYFFEKNLSNSINRSVLVFFK